MWVWEWPDTKAPSFGMTGGSIGTLWGIKHREVGVLVPCHTMIGVQWHMGTQSYHDQCVAVSVCHGIAGQRYRWTQVQVCDVTQGQLSSTATTVALTLSI